MQLQIPSEPILRMTGIHKRLGGIEILQKIDLNLQANEVLALVGEDGAGKSTLLRILGGVYADYDGTIEIGGKFVHPKSPLEAAQLGIAIVYDGHTLVPSMTVADNLFLGRSLTRAGFVADRTQRSQAQKLLDHLKIPIDATEIIEDLPSNQRRWVEIARAVALDAKIVAMDEPINIPQDTEKEWLRFIIEYLKKHGCGLLYATQQILGIEHIADRIMVLRDGRIVGESQIAELPTDNMVQWIMGRQVADQVPKRAVEKERTRIARTIHDDMGARLTHIALMCELGMRHSNNSAETISHFQSISETARQVAQSMDAIIWAINPANDILENLASYFSLYAENFLRLTPIRCRLDVPDFIPPYILTSEARHSLFLALREALNNTVRHSCASEAWLRIHVENNILCVAVDDNGKGFDPSKVHGNGLLNIKSRIAELNGQIDLQSSPGSGTRFTMRVPVDTAKPGKMETSH